MYTSSAVTGVAAGTGALAFTGFDFAPFIIVAVALIASGLLLVRLGRRRAARR